MENALMTDWPGPTLRLLAQSHVISTRIYWLLGVVLGLLVIAYVIGRLLKRYPDSGLNPALVERFNHRIRVWWLMGAILVAGFMLGRAPTVILFGLVSFWALREFITMTPTRRGDHRTLFWVFFVFTPAQYVMVGLGRQFDLYGLYSVAIPVYAFLFITARIAISGDHKRFLERSAKIQAGLFICVYCLSYAPALLNLNLVTSKGKSWGGSFSPITLPDGEAGPAHELAHLAGDRLPPDILPNAGLLFYFFLIVQLEDVLQSVWSRLAGRRVIAASCGGVPARAGMVGGKPIGRAEVCRRRSQASARGVAIGFGGSALRHTH
jgi:phosphatidate cytidylyltransferase